MRIDRFDVLAVRPHEGLVDVDVEVDCSSGTYIRALARDVGAALAVGGHLIALRRTRVGRFGLDQARTLDELAEMPQLSYSLDEACLQSFPRRDLTAEEAESTRHGRALEPAGIEAAQGGGTSGASSPAPGAGGESAPIAPTDRVSPPAEGSPSTPPPSESKKKFTKSYGA